MGKQTAGCRRELLAELCGLGHLVRGTVVDTLRKCGRAGCACENGKKHPFTYFSTSGKKGNRIVYVRASERRLFEAGCAAYRRAWEIIEALSAVNIQCIKQGDPVDDNADDQSPNHH